MATKIPIGTAAYFTYFDGGQGVGASNYFTYAVDLDTNFLLLRTTINTIIDEISAVSGPNATIALDLARWDDDQNPIDNGEPPHGVIGPASYEVSVVGGTLTVRKGQALVNLQKVTLISDLTGLTSSGGAGTRWVALDANGIVYIESAASQRSADLATVTWNGSQFTAGTVVHLLPVLFDGDSWAECQDRAAMPDVAILPAHTFRRVANRIRALELFLDGQDTGAEGEAIDGPIVLLPGTAVLPSLILGDGSTTFDTTSGWYRSASGHWGFSSGGVLRYELTDNGLRFAYLGDASTPAIRTTLAGLYFPAAGAELAVGCSGDLCMRWKTDTGNLAQALVADGVVGDPGFGFDQEENTGLYRPAAGQLAVALAGVQKALLTTNGLQLPDGAVGTPALSFLSETDLGLYRIGTDRLGIATAGTLRAEFDAEGNLDLPTNTGGIWRRVAAQTISDATATPISWDTEDRDVGGLLVPTATDITIPTGGDGLYLISLAVVWEGEATPVGYRDAYIRAAGVDYAPQRVEVWTNGLETKHATQTIVALSASDVVQGRVYNTQGGAGTDVTFARIALQKIA